MAGYAGTPLHRKLGITAESAVLLDGFQRSSGVATDLSENAVRDHAFANEPPETTRHFRYQHRVVSGGSHGRVGVKVCAIDEGWSGLELVIRKAER